MKNTYRIIILLSATAVAVGVYINLKNNSSDDTIVEMFQEYLQIDTSVPDNIDIAVKFWRRQAESIGVSFSVHYPAGLPVCVLTVRGSDPTLPSIMLNSHMDVVPVQPELWTYPPFAAHQDESGVIYGRGALDCKSLAIMQLEALRYFRDNTPLRTIHMTLMPDEELGSFRGMIPFLKSEEFKKMNVGFALDEGITSPSGDFLFSHVDKRPWQMKFTVKGESSHGAYMGQKIAVQRLADILNLALAFRKKQALLAQNLTKFELGNVTTVNINYIRGGIATNVVPSTMEMVVDMRLAVDEDLDRLNAMINSWIEEVGECSVEYLRHVNESLVTPVDDTNKYWTAIRDTLTNMRQPFRTVLIPATSDMLFVRELKIPALGFLPILHTVSNIHGEDECVDAAKFLAGCQTYRRVVDAVANIP